MTARGWKHHAWRLLFLFGLAAGIGALAGHPWAVVLVALGGFAAFELFNLWRLHRWLTTQAGAPPEGVGFWADIWDGIRQLSDEHRQESERYETRIRDYRNLTHAMPDALLVIAPDDTIASGNPAAETLLGLRLPADLGQAITHLVRVPGFSDWLAVQDHVQGDFEMASPVNDGQWLQVNAVPIQDGRRLIVFRDSPDESKLRRLLDAGLLVSADARPGPVPTHVRFFHDSMQSYLTARALYARYASQARWDCLWRAAGEPGFAREQSDLMTEAGSELFDECTLPVGLAAAHDRR